MHYQRVGDGPPILFLHGWGCDGSIFNQIAACIKGFSCYLVDLYGFGQSPSPPEEGWDVTQYAIGVINLMDRLSLSSVAIVGHSFGCRVAMVLAALYPQRIQNMLLVSPAGLRSFSLKRSFKVARYKLVKFFTQIIRNKDLVKSYGSDDYIACKSQLKNTLVKVVNQNLAPFASKIRCKVLIVNGNNDKETTPRHAARLNKLIENSSLVLLEGNHFCFFVNVSASARIVELFVPEDD